MSKLKPCPFRVHGERTASLTVEGEYYYNETFMPCMESMCACFHDNDDDPYCERNGAYMKLRQKGLAELGLKSVPSAQPDQRWIPVSEGLPKEYGEYICTMENGQVQECGFVPENQRGLVDGWSTCEADGHKFLGYADVLAWMPLPDPYKDDPCNGCGYLGESCVGEGCGKLTERKEGEAE